MLTEERYLRMLNRLRSGTATGACGVRIAALEPLRRLTVMSGLMVERLEHKLLAIRDIHSRAGSNWNMTFFVLFFRTLGDAANRESFMRLAWKVTCSAVLHERWSLAAVEAMMLGTSGLLQSYPADDYTRALRAEFEHLAHKYSIKPMAADEWKMHRINPRNHPVLRLAQAAAYFANREFVCREAIECRSADDLDRMFSAEASDYWMTHFTPGCESLELPKRLGRTKTALMGINLVAPMQFAYGRLTGNERICERAIDLLESIEPEDNRYIRRWTDYGTVPANALESQALLEMAVSYCGRNRCEECPLGRHILRDEADDDRRIETIRTQSW